MDPKRIAKLFITGVLILLLISLIVCFFKVQKSRATDPPVNALKYLPVLADVIIDCWNLENPDVLAGQVEQETCPSLKSSECWNPHAELKTSREYGFGLSQITIAYDAQGKERFNNFKEATKLDKVMKDWQWEDRYNPYYQLRFLVLQDLQYFNLIKWSDDELVKFAFALAGYNGGFYGMVRDRKICESTPGCDPNVWFGNVEKESWRAKTKVAGYGQSFFDINRSYVKNILMVRRIKYVSYWYDPAE